MVGTLFMNIVPAIFFYFIMDEYNMRCYFVGNNIHQI